MELGNNNLALLNSKNYLRFNYFLYRVIFPQTWSEYISCIKSFTASCLSSSQRSDFNRAVGDSINSVHKMCTNEDYKHGK